MVTFAPGGRGAGLVEWNRADEEFHMTVAQPAHTWTSPTTRRIGYVIAIGINAALLFVAQNILDWDVLPWLTAEWDDVLPIISVSLLASILANLIYVAYDAPWFKSLTQAIVAGIALAATIQLFRVFPFDFSAYEFNWEFVTKGVLILAMVGTTIGLIAEAAKFIRALAGGLWEQPS